MEIEKMLQKNKITRKENLIHTNTQNQNPTSSKAIRGKTNKQSAREEEGKTALILEIERKMLVR